MNSYMEQMKTNYSSWMRNAIGLEKEDWTSDRNPEVRLYRGCSVYYAYC